MRRFRGRRLGRRRFAHRRPSKRLFKRRRVVKEGNVLVKANTAAIVTLSTTGETSFAITPSADSFTETVPFLAAYENYRIRRVICRIRPNFNDGRAGVAEDHLPPYIIAAYHKAVSTSSTLTISNILSLDKHKYVGAYRGVRMAFTPAVQVSAIADTTVYQWRPQLSTTSGSSQSHYCGVIAWPAAPVATVSYTVEIQAHIEFMNQKINIV